MKKTKIPTKYKITAGVSHSPHFNYIYKGKRKKNKLVYLFLSRKLRQYA